MQIKRHINKTVRLKEYDYSQAGAYFITICVKKRKCLFGDIVKEKMILNNNGKIADTCWESITTHFKNVELGEYVVMPNHVHGIIVLHDDYKARIKEKKEKESVGQTHAFDMNLLNIEGSQRHTFDTDQVNAEKDIKVEIVGGRHAGKEKVGQRYIFDLPKDKRKYEKIPVIIGNYKAGVTREINKAHPGSGFKWQTSFHDHIIRNEKEMENITNYIMLNPARWNEDLENEENRTTLTDKQREKMLKEFYKNLK